MREVTGRRKRRRLRFFSSRFASSTTQHRALSISLVPIFSRARVCELSPPDPQRRLVWRGTRIQQQPLQKRELIIASASLHKSLIDFFSFQFLVENVEHLIKLSDEYQVKELIFDPCVKFLEDQTKTQENVMKILALANLYSLEKVRQGCIDLLRNMKLETLSETVHLKDLGKEETEYYLTQRIERLETFLDEMYPQFFGLVASLIWLLHKSKKWVTVCCSKHAPEGKLKSYSSSLEIRECSDCKQMLSSMVTATTTSDCGIFEPNGSYREVRKPYHGCKIHFDSKLFSVMADLSKLK